MLGLALSGALCALAPPAAAGPRLYVGLLDDPAFRWKADRHANLDRARSGGTTVIRTIVDWAHAAPRRPRRPAAAFATEYRLSDVDELVRNAEQRGIEVLLTIWGTPGWANGGAGRNVAPARVRDLRDFAHALASRYSGRNPGFPLVRFFSVWNEPNSALFLSPQFDFAGRPAAPRVYASLVSAAYAGIKQASPRAVVAAGETAPRGHDRRVARFHDSESPAEFARLVAAASPGLRFDTWAHHPYPRSDHERPGAPQPWPQVGLGNVGTFQTSLARWFHRPRVPLWLTEFAYRTSPQVAGAAAYPLQASYLRQALALARAEPGVEMFVWFGFRDRAGERWQSGLLDRRGRAKPALASFTDAGIRFRPTIEPLLQEGSKLRAGGASGAAAFGSGISLSADGTTALVGASGDADGAGAAWLLARSASGWRHSAKLTADDPGARTFGRSVALSADARTALVAGFDPGGAGTVWVFARTGSAWTQQATLVPGDESGESSFGVRVALSADGSTALVGGHGDAGAVGASWVFTRSGATWVQAGPKLTASDERGGGRFGVRVALSADGSTALIGGWNDDGGLGAAWVFARSGAAWMQQGPKLTPSDWRTPSTFGGSVALSADGDTALIGGEDDGGSVGAAWVFTRSGSTWTQRGPKLLARGENGGGFFGKSVSLSADGSFALVGGHADAGGVGAAWVFTRSGSSWAQQGSKMTGTGEVGAGAFGARTALSADGTIAIISGFDDDQSVGAVWAFASPLALAAAAVSPRAAVR